MFEEKAQKEQWDVTENLNYAWKSNAEILSVDQSTYNGKNRKQTKNI